MKPSLDKAHWGLWLWPLLGIGALGMWSHGQQQQLRSQLAQVQVQQQQQLAELNDRLVALGRHTPEVAATAAPAQTELAYQVDQQTVRTRLLLAQQAIHHQQFAEADQLLALQQQQLAVAHAVPNTLRQLLGPLIGRDRQRLQAWIHQKNSHDLQIDTRLSQLQSQLDHLALQAPQLALASDRQTVWQRLGGMIRIEPVQPQTAQRMALRALSCREAALTLGLARQAVSTHPERLALLLQQVDQQLATLPEPRLQAVRQQVRAIAALPAPVWTGLESVRLLPGAVS